MIDTFRRIRARYKSRIPELQRQKIKAKELKLVTPKIQPPKASPTRSKEAAATVITVSTPFGFKSFALGRVTKRAIISFSIFIVLLLIFGSLGLFFTFTNNMALETLLDDTKNGYQSLIAENRGLKTVLEAELASKEKEAALESLAGLKSESAPVQKLDLSTVSVEQKTMLLRNIPNGSPVSFGGITSHFGSRNHPVLGRSMSHEGVDLKAEKGAKVYSAADGIVDTTKYNGGYGNMLIVTHAYGFTSVYAHLSRFVVRQGEFVKKGQLVAYSGNTGRTSGPHLHYEVRFMNEPINPEPFVGWSYANFAYLFEKESRVKWGSLVDATRWQTQAERLSYQAGQKSSVN